MDERVSTVALLARCYPSVAATTRMNNSTVLHATWSCITAQEKIETTISTILWRMYQLAGANSCLLTSENGNAACPQQATYGTSPRRRGVVARSTRCCLDDGLLDPAHETLPLRLGGRLVSRARNIRSHGHAFSAAGIRARATAAGRGHRAGAASHDRLARQNRVANHVLHLSLVRRVHEVAISGRHAASTPGEDTLMASGRDRCFWGNIEGVGGQLNGTGGGCDVTVMHDGADGDAGLLFQAPGPAVVRSNMY
jgi:hypothetical protein